MLHHQQVTSKKATLSLMLQDNLMPNEIIMLANNLMPNEIILR